MRISRQTSGPVSVHKTVDFLYESLWSLITVDLGRKVLVRETDLPVLSRKCEYEAEPEI